MRRARWRGCSTAPTWTPEARCRLLDVLVAELTGERRPAGGRGGGRGARDRPLARRPRPARVRPGRGDQGDPRRRLRRPTAGARDRAGRHRPRARPAVVPVVRGARRWPPSRPRAATPARCAAHLDEASHGGPPVPAGRGAGGAAVQRRRCSRTSPAGTTSRSGTTAGRRRCWSGRVRCTPSASSGWPCSRCGCRRAGSRRSSRCWASWPGRTRSAPTRGPWPWSSRAATTRHGPPASRRRSCRSDYFTTFFATVRAKAVVALGAADEAPALVALLAPLHDQLGGALSTSLAVQPVAHTLGELHRLLGDRAAAAGFFAEAERVARRWGAAHWADAARAELAAG